MQTEKPKAHFPLLRPGRQGQRGYTLTEISLAILILGIGLSGVLSVFPVAVTWGGGAIANKTGSLAARNVASKLEELAADPKPGSGNPILFRLRFYFWEPGREYLDEDSGGGVPGDMVFPVVQNGYYYECNSTHKLSGSEPLYWRDDDQEEFKPNSNWICHRAMIRVPEYPQWEAGEAYKVGDYVRPTDDFLENQVDSKDIWRYRSYRYRCVVAGESSSSERNWSGVDTKNQLVDNTVTWERERYEGYYCTFFPYNSRPSKEHTWYNNTPYKLGDYVLIPERWRRAVCVQKGTSSSSEPDWDDADTDTGILDDGSDLVWHVEEIDPGDRWTAEYDYKDGDIISPFGSNRTYLCTDAVNKSDVSGVTEPDWNSKPLKGDTISDGDIEWECLGVNELRRMVIQVHRQDPKNPQYGEDADLAGVYEASIYDYCDKKIE